MSFAIIDKSFFEDTILFFSIFASFLFAILMMEVEPATDTVPAPAPLIVTALRVSFDSALTSAKLFIFIMELLIYALVLFCKLELLKEPPTPTVPPPEAPPVLIFKLS